MDTKDGEEQHCRNKRKGYNLTQSERTTLYWLIGEVESGREKGKIINKMRRE